MSDTANKFGVGMNFHNQQVQFLVPVPRVLSAADALNLAAWIIVLAADDDEEFNRLLDDIRNT